MLVGSGTFCGARLPVLAVHSPRTANQSASGKLSGPEALISLRDTTLIRAKQYNWQSCVDDLVWDWLKSAAATADHDDDPVKWTEAAHNEALARNMWVENGATLDQAYYDR